MDDFTYIILGLAIVLAIPGVAIAAFVMVLGARTRIAVLEREMLAMRRQLALFATRPGLRSEPDGVEAAGSVMPGDSPIAPKPVQLAAVAEPTLPKIEAAEAAIPPPEQISATHQLPQPPPPLPTVAIPEGAGMGSPPPPPPAPSPKRSFEEAIGTRWTVWIGGLALALGGVFLVKYSIDEGVFTPAMRIALAAVFSAALIAIGEYLRRRDPVPTEAAAIAAPIPAILTAAGTIAAFATIYGAYGLYHLIGDVTAFVLLGAVAVGTMLAALLHGPWIATLGIFGAYATPLLVASAEPNLVALVSYLLAVTIAAFGVARVRLWHLVALWALALALVWGVFISFAFLATKTGGRNSASISSASSRSSPASSSSGSTMRSNRHSTAGRISPV